MPRITDLFSKIGQKSGATGETHLFFFFGGANLPVIFLELADRSPDLESWLGPNRQSRFGPKKPTALFLMTAASSAVHRRHSKGSLGGCWKGGPVVLCTYFDCEMCGRNFSQNPPQVFGWIFQNVWRINARFQRQRTTAPPPKISNINSRHRKSKWRMPERDGRRARCPMAIGATPVLPWTC